MHDLISIIIPVYNMEQYLRECLSSMINQTYKNIEIILVDDGSTDNSGTICDDYCSKDNRIKVIHKKNGGLAEARNIGIKKANGDYLMFVDSDDIVTSNYVERLYSVLVESNADVACSPYKKIFDSNELQIENENQTIVVSNVSSVEQLLYQNKMFHTGAHGKIYKKEVWTNITFPLGMYYEDLGTLYKVLFNAKKVAGIGDHLYGYRIRKDSIMRQSYNPRKLSCIPISRELYEYISKKCPELQYAAATRCFSVNRAIFWQLSPKNEGYDEIWLELCKYRKIVLNNSSARFRDRIMAGISMLGKGVFHLFSLPYRIQQMGRIY